MSDYILHNGELMHFGVKGMKWGGRRHSNVGSTAASKQAKKTIKDEKKAKREKMNEELQEVGYKNGFGYNASKHAKSAIASGVAALGVAVVGSAATNILAKKGKQYAAQQVFKISKQTFDVLAFSTKVSAGFAAVNAMMGGAQSVADYKKAEKEIRNKYR